MNSGTARRLKWRERFFIRQCVGSAILPCGCTTGRYLSYSEELFEVIDQRGSRCANDGHQLGAIVDLGPRPAWMDHASA